MRAGGGKQKGSAFERKVAKLIRVAAKRVMKVKKSDVYRTPMSGGHIHAKRENPSDLVISKRVRKRFPFVVECKHYRRIRYLELMTPSFEGGIHKWIEQVKKCVKGNRYCPLVVMMENRGNIFCAFPLMLPMATGPYKPRRGLLFMHGKEQWCLMLFSTFLKAVFKEQS